MGALIVRVRTGAADGVVELCLANLAGWALGSRVEEMNPKAKKTCVFGAGQISEAFL